MRIVSVLWCVTLVTFCAAAAKTAEESASSLFFWQVSQSMTKESVEALLVKIHHHSLENMLDEKEVIKALIDLVDTKRDYFQTLAEQSAGDYCYSTKAFGYAAMCAVIACALAYGAREEPVLACKKNLLSVNAQDIKTASLAQGCRASARFPGTISNPTADGLLDGLAKAQCDQDVCTVLSAMSGLISAIKLVEGICLGIDEWRAQKCCEGYADVKKWLEDYLSLLK